MNETNKSQNRRGRPKKERDYNSPFATRLRSLLEERNITQQKMADDLHIPRQNINQLVLGNSAPSVERLCEISTYFDVSADYLLGLTPDNVKTRDVDKAAVSLTTGLSDKSVDNLLVFNRHKKQLIDMLNVLIESEEIYEVGRVEKHSILSYLAEYLLTDIDIPRDVNKVLDEYDPSLAREVFDGDYNPYISYRIKDTYSSSLRQKNADVMKNILLIELQKMLTAFEKRLRVERRITSMKLDPNCRLTDKELNELREHLINNE